MKPPEIKRLPIIQYHDLVIDPQCHTVALSGEKIILFPKEFNVLLLLAHYPGWVLRFIHQYGMRIRLTATISYAIQFANCGGSWAMRI